MLSASHAALGVWGNTMARVDGLGNRQLINAAARAGVAHFVFTSAGTGLNDPVDFFRLKAETEQYLDASGMPYTVLRPGAFMDEHAERIGRPIMTSGTTMVMGPGCGRANYVAVRDVASLAVLVLDGPPRRDIVWIGGPENLSALEVVAIYERVAGRTAKVRHVPLGLLRVVRRLFGPVARRIVDTVLLMETGQLTIDMQATLATYPLRLTSLEQFVRNRYRR